MRKKILTIFVSVVLLISLITIIFWNSLFLSPAIISRTFEIEANQEITDQFVYEDLSGMSDISANLTSANLTLYISNMQSPGRIRIIINEFFYGYAEINSTGYAEINSVCSAVASRCTSIFSGSYAFAIVKEGDNLVTITSDAFAGELKYTIENWNSESG